MCQFFPLKGNEPSQMERNAPIASKNSRIDTFGDPDHLRICPDFPPLARPLSSVTTGLFTRLPPPLCVRLTDVCGVSYFHFDGGYTDRVNFFFVWSWSCTYTSFDEILERDNVDTLRRLRKRGESKEVSAGTVRWSPLGNCRRHLVGSWKGVCLGDVTLYTLYSWASIVS